MPESGKPSRSNRHLLHTNQAIKALFLTIFRHFSALAPRRQAQPLRYLHVLGAMKKERMFHILGDEAQIFGH